jgi:hypothetical protein
MFQKDKGPMDLDIAIIHKLMHDTLKPIRAAADCFGLIKLGPESGMNPDITTILGSGLDHTAKALQDFDICASCEQELAWETIDWKELVEGQISRLRNRKKLSFDSELQDSKFRSLSAEGLPKYALDNLTWFATHYSNQLSGIMLAACTNDGKPSIRITYRIKLPLIPNSEFSLCSPFYPLSKETLALTHNTGLVLYAVKKIAELHDGRFTLTLETDHTVLELLLPIVDLYGG